MRPRVAVLHHPRSFFPLDLTREIGDEIEIVWVVDETTPEQDSTRRLLPRLGPVVDITGLDLNQAAKRLRNESPAGIVSFVDDHIEIAAALADNLGLLYHSPGVARAVVDKCVQRGILDAAGVPGPDFWLVPNNSTPAKLADLATQVTFPAVLKPAEGSGSRGIRLVESPEELVSSVIGGRLDGNGLDHGDPDRGYIVESYLHDDAARVHSFASYFSVESVVSGGRISHAAITGRFPLAEGFRETGNFVPGILDSSLRDPVFAMVDSALLALGVTDSVIHTEIKLTPDGPKLIEVNGRLGGRPPFVLGSVSDANLFKATFDVALGTPVAFDAMVACDGVGFWLMIQPPTSARRIAAVAGLDLVSDVAGVSSVALGRRPGEAVDWRDGTASQVVTVRGKVADHEALRATVDAVHDTLRIEYASS